jgi:hypothetical protein
MGGDLRSQEPEARSQKKNLRIKKTRIPTLNPEL